MRALVQRVDYAAVRVDDTVVGEVGQGLLVFLGVGADDDDADRAYVIRKVTGLRIFEDTTGRMNRSVIDVHGSILLVSQFTLYGDLRKGRRPGFDAAAAPELALRHYQLAVAEMSQSVPVQTGTFGAHMQVDLRNDGPATFWIDSRDCLQK